MRSLQQGHQKGDKWVVIASTLSPLTIHLTWQAREDLRSLIENMPAADRDSLLKTSKKSKGDTKFIPFVTKPDQTRVGDENKPAERATSPRKIQSAASVRYRFFFL